MITKIKSHKEFCEIAKSYRKNLKEINLRIKRTSEDTEKAILSSMARDLKENIEELENYYKKDYWRSEKITMNARKAIKRYINTSEQE